MSTPDPSTTPVTTPEAPDWTEEDVRAVVASAAWLDMKAPPELIKQYEGMHIAVLGEEIIEADRDKDAFYRRLDARLPNLPYHRLLVRYIPTQEEAWLYW